MLNSMNKRTGVQYNKAGLVRLNCVCTPALESDKADWPLGDTAVGVISAQIASDCKPKAENNVDKLVMLRFHDTEANHRQHVRNP